MTQMPPDALCIVYQTLPMVEFADIDENIQFKLSTQRIARSRTI
jgi:hypothetical protein